MITVTINGTEYKQPEGVNLGSLLSREHLKDMPCGGRGQCGKCRVTAAGALSAPTESELKLLTADEIASGVRLACRTEALGDCTVTFESAAPMQISGAGEMPNIALEPAFENYGAAVDIGSTTLAASLYDANGVLTAKAGRTNPQSAWGADVISRISAALKGESRNIAAAVRKAVDGLLCELAEKAGISTCDIDGAVITGNTVMLHLLTETSTEPLSHAPFAAERLFGETVTAGELELHSISPDTEVYLPPCAAAFVGADMMTALLASDICRMKKTNLIVDIGTNGEMALWRDNKLTFCSTAAGPAFEGAGISMGMGGTAGAIDRVCLKNGELAAHVIGDAAPSGICGSGIVDAVACLLAAEEIDETGYLENDPAEIISPVTVSQKDIRAVQLAKSAVHAGIRTLMHHAGVDCEAVCGLYIAGGFGGYLDIQNAGRIGLIPEELTGKVRVIGNAALSGAAMLLLNRRLRSECAEYAASAETVELSTDPVFAQEYMKRMMF